jgi:hypothetical protein
MISLIRKDNGDTTLVSTRISTCQKSVIDKKKEDFQYLAWQCSTRILLF